MKAAWMEVGLAQRDLPVHVVNEYFHPHRSFYPRPAFNEETLPRNLTFYNFITGGTSALFPLVVSDSAGLGVDFALIRGAACGGWRAGRPYWPGAPEFHAGAGLDLAAVSHLDVVRTADLTLSRENLQPRGPEHMPS